MLMIKRARPARAYARRASWKDSALGGANYCHGTSTNRPEPLIFQGLRRQALQQQELRMRGFVLETRILASGRHAEILAALGIPTTRRGAHIRCPFPSHPDRNPSWRWDDRTERWHCTCGHGDILDLVVQMGRASSLFEAAVYVRQVLGLPVGNVREETPEQARSSEGKASREAGRERAATG
jgi:hypothetical protein